MPLTKHFFITGICTRTRPNRVVLSCTFIVCVYLSYSFVYASALAVYMCALSVSSSKYLSQNEMIIQCNFIGSLIQTNFVANEIRKKYPVIFVITILLKKIAMKYENLKQFFFNKVSALLKTREEGDIRSPQSFKNTYFSVCLIIWGLTLN